MASKIPFKTAYGERERYFINPGSQIEDVYGYEINKFGQKVLVKTGETNIYERIQASLEETKIENVLKRVAMGDNSVLRPDGIYADISEAPKNLIEARQQMQKLENLWNGLPIEVREKYNHSLEDFIAKSGSEGWLKDMGLLKEDPIQFNEETKTEGGNEE